jgi:ACR3 family arsenite transporter
MSPILHLVLFAVLSHATLSAARVAVSLYAVSLDSTPAVVGVLIEVPVMLTLVAFANRTRGWFPATDEAQSTRG